MKKDLAVVGLGYVGIPLALGFAEAGCTVLGWDEDTKKIHRLEKGESPLPHIPSSRVAAAQKSGRFEVSELPNGVSECDAILVCVPTPIRIHREPDLSHILGAARWVGPHLRKGMLVCLESSTYPGTTEGEFRQELERLSGLKAGEDFALAFAPEREDPGNPLSELRRVPRVVGGLTKSCRERAVRLYSRAIDHVVPVDNCRTAEAVKLAENIFRFINIALVNELKVIYGRMDIDIQSVIQAASTKPYGFMPFQPSAGVGGHCIPIDPFYLTWKAREYGLETRMIQISAEINDAMPRYVVERVVEAMNHRGKTLKGARVLVVGIAYKPNIADDRSSPAYAILEELQRYEPVLSYYDPHIPEIYQGSHNGCGKGMKSVPWDEELLKRQDVAIVVTAHNGIDYGMLERAVGLVVDTCGVFRNKKTDRIVQA